VGRSNPFDAGQTPHVNGWFCPHSPKIDGRKCDISFGFGGYGLTVVPETKDMTGLSR
jgi:hypothetical protein